jgi:hypothetical protein
MSQPLPFSTAFTAATLVFRKNILPRLALPNKNCQRPKDRGFNRNATSLNIMDGNSRNAAILYIPVGQGYLLCQDLDEHAIIGLNPIEPMLKSGQSQDKVRF